MSIKVYIKPENLEEIHTYFPNAFVSAGNATDPHDAALVVGYVSEIDHGEYNPPTYNPDYRTYGYDAGGGSDWLARYNEQNSRIACYITNFHTDENGPYLEINDGGHYMPSNTFGLAIATNNSNLVQEQYADTGQYKIFKSDQSGISSLDAAIWNPTFTVSPIMGSPDMFDAIYQQFALSDMVSPLSIVIDAKIPIFTTAAAAKTYVDTGVIEENTCFNPPGAISDVGDNDYFVRSWTYRYNKYKNYVDHDDEKHRLDVKAGGNTVVGYLEEGEYFNVRLKASGSHTMVWYTSDGGTYTGSAEDFNNSRQARGYNTYNQYKPYQSGFVKGGWWNTNIYIYADEADADMALEHPESVLPINPDDVDDSWEPGDTGLNTDTEHDLVSQVHDGATGLITLYRSTAGALNQLGAELYTASQSLLDALKIYGESPINSLISVHHCPINHEI